MVFLKAVPGWLARPELLHRVRLHRDQPVVVHRQQSDEESERHLNPDFEHVQPDIDPEYVHQLRAGADYGPPGND